MKKRILIADDDPLACRILTRMLGGIYEVAVFANGEEAFRHFAAAGADLVLTDLKMPKMHGFELLDRIREIDPRAIVFVITGFSSIDNAVAAVKKGAYDYIAKPYDPDDVQIRIARAFKEKDLEQRVSRLQQERQIGKETPPPLTGNPGMRQLLDMAKKVARTDSNVLIQGETGVGKELVARLVHNWSPRAEHAFVPVNCGALAEGVLESELFGHEKGAFTGAAGRRLGYFELADKGTLMLDEIGTTDHNFQVKLLRVLQDRMIYRVGSATPIPVDVRIVAATNLDLARAVREEVFRSDLYYRLSVVTLQVPPLRERMEDLPLLVRHFIRKYQQINPRVSDVSQDGLRRLENYSYPGNVRELENIIERAMILESGDRLCPASLLVGGGEENVEGGGESAPPLAIEEAEKEHIQRVLRQCNGRKAEAARLLGINKTTLWRKLKKYGMAEEAG